MGYRVKTNYDRGYVNAMEKLKIHLVVDAEMTKAQLMDILKKADVI